MKFQVVRAFTKKAIKEEKGLSLLEIVVVLIILAIMGAIAVPRLFATVGQANVTALTEFIQKVESEWVKLINNPLCPAPTDKKSFINEASDSQCRADTTDKKGDIIFPAKVNNKWDWDIQNNQLVIKNVAPNIGNQVVKIRTECSYDSGNHQITCPLATAPQT